MTDMTTLRWAAGRALAGLIAVCLFSAGCGVRPESDAHRTPPADVPFGLLEDPADATAAAPEAQTVTVFLFRDKHLIPVERTAPKGTGLADIADLVALGPTQDERSLGLVSSLPTGQIASIKAVRGVAQVDLSDTFADLRSRDQILAIAQLVFSLTARPGIGRVSFTLDGAATEVPRSDGALTTDALAREDFEALAPAP
ncbi:MAG: GerMN domain-containing protein [Aquihabitans sp.]